jgi:hypothetical protein
MTTNRIPDLKTFIETRQLKWKFENPELDNMDVNYLPR